MKNAEKFKEIFKEFATEVWAFPEKDFLTWLNAEYEEPTAKNDLGVDCISREQALVAIRNLYPGMPRVDFNGSLRKWVDKYKPYIECDDAIKQLPSVTPQPRKGHWTEEFNDLEGEVRFTCSSCGKYQLFGTDFCYHCGAKMVEPQESEG
jgi:hypothetical protein